MKWLHIILATIWMAAVLAGGIAIVWTGAEENALRKQRGAYMKERRDLLTEQGRLHATLTMEGNLSRVQAAVERLRLPLAPPQMRPGQTVPVLATDRNQISDDDATASARLPVSAQPQGGP